MPGLAAAALGCAARHLGACDRRHPDWEFASVRLAAAAAHTLAAAAGSLEAVARTGRVAAAAAVAVGTHRRRQVEDADRMRRTAAY